MNQRPFSGLWERDQPANDNASNKKAGNVSLGRKCDFELKEKLRDKIPFTLHLFLDSCTSLEQVPFIKHSNH